MTLMKLEIKSDYDIYLNFMRIRIFIKFFIYGAPSNAKCNI
jgi:hypothetical protein